MGYLEDYEAQHRGNKPYVGGNVKFKMEAIPDDTASRIAGRPIYKDLEVIEITFPGQPSMKFAAEEKHKRSYPVEYNAFKAGLEPAPQGLPLEQWAMPTKAIIENLKGLGFRTVEQLAEAKDDVIGKMRSLSIWVRHAQDYLKACNDGATKVIGLKAELDHLREVVKSQSNMIEQLLQRIDINEGTAMSTQYERPSLELPQVENATPTQMEALSTDKIPNTAPKRRGRPRKESIENV